MRCQPSTPFLAIFSIVSTCTWLASPAPACEERAFNVVLEPVAETAEARPADIVVRLDRVDVDQVKIVAEVTTAGRPVPGTAGFVERAGIMEDQGGGIIAVFPAPSRDPLPDGAYAERVLVTVLVASGRPPVERTLYRYFEILAGHARPITSTEYSELTADIDEHGGLRTAVGPTAEPGRQVNYVPMVHSGDLNAAEHD